MRVHVTWKYSLTFVGIFVVAGMTVITLFVALGSAWAYTEQAPNLTEVVAPAHHVFTPPPGEACKTVILTGWYNGGPSAVIVYAYDTSKMRPVMDGNPLPVTWAWGAGIYERFSFNHEPSVWITSLEFEHVGPHYGNALWFDCTSG